MCAGRTVQKKSQLSLAFDAVEGFYVAILCHAVASSGEPPFQSTSVVSLFRSERCAHAGHSTNEANKRRLL